MKKILYQELEKKEQIYLLILEMQLQVRLDKKMHQPQRREI
jgi:hypothetical protein